MNYLQTMEHQLVNNMGTVTKTQVADLHASSSSLKSFCSMTAADGIEECRKACGGHGFLQCSGLPELFTTYLQNPTVEGDNHMLPQQSVRVLLKLVQIVTDDDTDGMAAYKNCDSHYLIAPMQRILSSLGEGAKTNPIRWSVQSTEDMLSLPLLLQAYQHRSARLLFEVAQELQSKMMGEENDMASAWNDCLIRMSAVSKAHALCILLKNFIEAVNEVKNDTSSPLGKAEINVLTDCIHLFALYWIEKDLGDFMEDSYISRKQSKMLRDLILQMLKKVRYNAVALVDAWDFSDFRLKSALGKANGDVYPAIMDAAKRDPLNDTNEGPGYVHLKKLYVDGVGSFNGTVSRL